MAIDTTVVCAFTGRGEARGIQADQALREARRTKKEKYQEQPLPVVRAEP